MASAGQQTKSQRKVRHNRAPITLPPEVRYVVRQEFPGLAQSAAVRTLVLEALSERGWGSSRIRKAFTLYRLQCEKDGVENEFPGRFL